MPKAFMTRGLSIAALAAAVFLASCTTKEPEAPPPPPPPPPPASLNEGVAQAASIYVAFLREAETIQPGGFTDAEAVQAAIRKGVAFEPAQLSRGLIAYGSIIALQSPEFVAGVRQFAVDPVQRQEMVARIVADPAYAATLPGADAAAGLISATIAKDAVVIRGIAEAVEAALKLGHGRMHGFGPGRGRGVAQGAALYAAGRAVPGHRRPGRPGRRRRRGAGQYGRPGGGAEQRILPEHVQADAVPVPGGLAPQL